MLNNPQLHIRMSYLIVGLLDEEEVMSLENKLRGELALCPVKNI